MANINNYLLDKLNENIVKLTGIVDQYDQIKLDTPCFDPSLFKNTTSYRNYRDYLAEINRNHQQFIALINKNSDEYHLEQINYLAQLLLNQITALRKALLLRLKEPVKSVNTLGNDKTQMTQTQTTTNRSVTIKNDTIETNTIETLYDKYNKNLGYLRRLTTMQYELAQEPSNSQKITILNQRIARCKHAIAELELQLEQQIEEKIK